MTEPTYFDGFIERTCRWCAVKYGALATNSSCPECGACQIAVMSIEASRVIIAVYQNPDASLFFEFRNQGEDSVRRYVFSSERLRSIGALIDFEVDPKGAK